MSRGVGGGTFKWLRKSGALVISWPAVLVHLPGPENMVFFGPVVLMITRANFVFRGLWNCICQGT